MGYDYTFIRVKYYLTRWKMLEENRNVLTPDEIKQAKILFNSLPKLPSDELELLKNKYYHNDRKSNFDTTRGVYRAILPISDKTMAYHEKIELGDYSKLRIQAELNLEKIMLETGQQLLKTEERITLKINRFLYIKHIEIKPAYGGTSIELGDITLSTGDILPEKQVFDMTDPIISRGVERLERYGFMREVAEDYEAEN